MDDARIRILDEGLFDLKKKTIEGSCCVKHCRNPAKNRRKKVGDCWFCDRCWQRRWRNNNPKKSAYRSLKDHAAGRRIEFKLDYYYFLGVMDAAASWDFEAESRGDMVSIDRIDASKGYVHGNIRVVTVSENVAKGNRERYLPDVVQDILRRKREEFLEEITECPF